jgi:uncharacterized protein YecE (DUF72 family)
MKRSLYFLGCPVWASARWQGNLFTQHAKRDQWLSQYSQVFNAVEGNSTFYALPSKDAVQRWVDATKAPFRFVLKFPQAISHEHRLVNAEAETEAFLEILRILDDGQRLGPAFLQLPPTFSASHLDDLETYLRRLPTEFAYAVEVRHADFFDQGKNERALNHLLAELRVDRVLFDSRPLFSAPPSDDHERASQSRKPQLPVHRAVTARSPIVRLVGRNDVRSVIPWIREWAPTVAAWIISGMVPYVFTHTPDELYAPLLARMFHDELRQHTHRVTEMEPWPGEVAQSHQRQLALF